jgi:hypothetical protein
MIDWKTKGTALYQQLPGECHATLKLTEALTEISANRPKQQDIYKTWNEEK